MSKPETVLFDGYVEAERRAVAASLDDPELVKAFRLYNSCGVEAALAGNKSIAGEYYETADIYGIELTHRSITSERSSGTPSSLGRIVSKLLRIKPDHRTEAAPGEVAADNLVS